MQRNHIDVLIFPINTFLDQCSVSRCHNIDFKVPGYFRGMDQYRYNNPSASIDSLFYVFGIGIRFVYL